MNWPPSHGEMLVAVYAYLPIYVLYIIGRVKNATGLCTKWSMRVLFFIYSRPVHACVHVSIIFMFVCCVLYHILQRFKTAGQL